jgi:hypothetical protein
MVYSVPFASLWHTKDQFRPSEIVSAIQTCHPFQASTAQPAAVRSQPDCMACERCSSSGGEVGEQAADGGLYVGERDVLEERLRGWGAGCWISPCLAARMSRWELICGWLSWLRGLDWLVMF